MTDTYSPYTVDLTDRFDHTFIFGDLNFRLDVTRLHADWLISRRGKVPNFLKSYTQQTNFWCIQSFMSEYAQALAFDQLSKVMKEGTALSGFAEAPIDFPPTFKYDVLPSLKRRKTHSRSYKYFPKTPTTAVPGTPQHAKMLTGVEEEKSKFRHEHERREEEKERDSAEGDDRSADSAEGEGDGQGEAASLASTTWTSAASRYTSDLEDRERDFRESQEEEYFSSRPSISLSSLSRDQGSASPTFSANTMANTNNNANMNGLASPGNLVHKMWTAAAAHKAKSKFVSLLTSSPAPGTPKGKWGRPKKGFLGGNKNGLHLDLHLHPHGEASAPNSPMALTPGFASPGPGSGWTPTPTPGFQTTTFPPTPGPSGVGSEDSDDVGGPREGEHDEKYLKASRSAVSSTEILRKNSAISSKSARRSEDKERGKDQEKDNSPQDVAEDDKGVYDSSHKKRVPSW